MKLLFLALVAFVTGDTASETSSASVADFGYGRGGFRRFRGGFRGGFGKYRPRKTYQRGRRHLGARRNRVRGALGYKNYGNINRRRDRKEARQAKRDRNVYRGARRNRRNRKRAGARRGHRNRQQKLQKSRRQGKKYLQHGQNRAQRKINNNQFRQHALAGRKNRRKNISGRNDKQRFNRRRNKKAGKRIRFNTAQSKSTNKTNFDLDEYTNQNNHASGDNSSKNFRNKSLDDNNYTNLSKQGKKRQNSDNYLKNNYTGAQQRELYDNNYKNNTNKAHLDRFYNYDDKNDDNYIAKKALHDRDIIRKRGSRYLGAVKDQRSGKKYARSASDLHAAKAGQYYGQN